MYVPRELDEPVFDVEQSPASQHHNDVDSATTAKTSGSLGRWPRTDYSVYATMSRFVSTSDRPRTSRGQLDYGVVKRAASMPSSRASRISDQVEREATRGSVIKEASESDDDDDDDDDSKSDYVHFNPADPLFLPPRAAPILRLDCSNTAQSSGIERVSRPRLRSAAVLSDEQFQSLLDKEGAVQCRHTRQNGKLVPRQQWTDAYLVLTGAIIGFYKSGAAARKPDGTYNMPDSSIVLQGATAQLTGRQQDTFDIVLLTSATNTQYFIQTADISETQSWCCHLKHNIAVLLAERSARMLHAKPVSTFSITPTTPSRRGILTFFEFEMFRIGQLLRELLSRRPSREDLERRGIYKEPMFGSSLLDVCAKDNSNVPLFLVSCFEQIEQTGLDTAGIYRHSGSVAKIQNLRIQANQGDYNVSKYGVHELTGAVKLFFRELSEPLIPVSLLDQFITVYRIDDERVRRAEFIALIHQLPEPHRHTLAQLLIHLERVSEHSCENQMTPHNLAIVFGPTLMWSGTPCEEGLSTTVVLQGKLVEHLITDRHQLFNVVATRL